MNILIAFMAGLALGLVIALLVQNRERKAFADYRAKVGELAGFFIQGSEADERKAA